MCGIAGIVGAKDNLRIHPATIRRMCQTIVHRGPDQEGIFVGAGAGLGMRRLSIVDLAGGSQPVFNEDRSVWVVFNGEIYNFREIRGELEKNGHRFQSDCDTEVIVHLYEDFGSECVKKLRGMFAFALFDEQKHRLLLARDRLGIKPLHYALFRGELFFGSEIKAILAVEPELSEINHQALQQYFYFGYIPDPLTAFLPIRKLPPGHILEFDGEKAQIRKYWDLPKYGTYAPRSEGECLEELEEKLAEAVRIRMMADVPLGAFLSGGIDSSTIVALMARFSAKPVKTFSIGFRDAESNEAPYARRVAQQFGTDHHELILEPNIVDTVHNLGQSLEEPFGDSSMLPTHFVSSLAREFVTVVLSGDGGDELFGGYERYRILRNGGRNEIPQWVGKSYREFVYPRLSGRIPGQNLAYSKSLPWPERYIEAVSFAPYQRRYRVLQQNLFGPFEGPHEIFHRYLEEAPAGDALSRVLYLDSKTYLPGDILSKVDRMSMLASLEARIPLLDHVLLEWVTSLRPEWKIRGQKQKYSLTKLAERLGVPCDVLYRPKRGFALPLVRWMRRELKNLVEDILLDPTALQRGYFRENGVRSLLSDFFQGRTEDYLPIWRLMMFELWQRNGCGQRVFLNETVETRPQQRLGIA